MIETAPHTSAKRVAQPFSKPLTSFSVEFEVGAYLKAVVDLFTAEFMPSGGTTVIKMVSLYPVREDEVEASFEKLTVPCILLNLHEFEPIPSSSQHTQMRLLPSGGYDMTEQTPVEIKMEAHIVVPFTFPRCQVVVRKVATDVASFVVRQGRFLRGVQEANALPIIADGRVEIESIYHASDAETKNGKRYVVWGVDWSQQTWLGAGEDPTPDVIPSELYVSEWLEGKPVEESVRVK